MHGWRLQMAHRWSALRSTFWFVPAACVGAGMALAAVALSVDVGLIGARPPAWLVGGGADGARALLSTVATSIVTVAGVAFSITLVALVLASTQFGPRLLTVFMRDVVSQVTLGVFSATFVYCLLVLRAIRGAEEGGEFVPHFAMTIGIVLTLASVALLVYFFHHVAVSIQAPRLVASVAHDLDAAIGALGRGRDAGRGGPAPRAGDIPEPGHDAVIRAEATGYIQLIDDAGILQAAIAHDLRIAILRRPGLFVLTGDPVLAIRPGVDDAAQTALRGTVIIGTVRTAEDDLEFSVRQLVEVALRALSPAINDPFTAMAAIDWLGAALRRIAEEGLPPKFRYDDDGTLRVVADSSTFGGIAHTVFSRIRHYGGSSPMVLNRLLEAVAAFGPHVADESDRAIVRAEADAVLRVGRHLLASDLDVGELERRHAAAVTALGVGGTSAAD